MLLTSSPIPWRLVGVAVAALAFFGGGCFVGAKWVHADWAEETARQAEAERLRIERIRDEMESAEMSAYALSQKYEADKQRQEADHARALAKQRKALAAPLSCPPGATLGDLVIPSAAIDGLRDASGADRIHPPKPAASEPGR
jgi:hypothetical protein